MDRARRDGVPLSVAILDLDHFKRFNDRYGHQAGDRLLKSATVVWSRMLRTTDLLCRYGGEEFSVLLPDATSDRAAEVLERLRQVTPQGQTFSAGLASWDGREASEELGDSCRRRVDQCEPLAQTMARRARASRRRVASGSLGRSPSGNGSGRPGAGSWANRGTRWVCRCGTALPRVW
jgi:GGDEF domain-containing protein